MNTDEHDIASLLERAAPRSDPPDDVRDRVFAAVEGEWLRHRRRRWRIPMALAASLTALLLLGWLVNAPPEVTNSDIASSPEGLWVNGTLHGSGSQLALSPGMQLVAESTTRLVLDNGTDLRLRGGTRATWLGTSFQLQDGAVYIDTGPGSRLQVTSRWGTVRDVGTTFMVTVTASSLEVAMRDGMTEISAPSGTFNARANALEGDVVTVTADRIAARAEPASATRWQWTHDVHPGYQSNEVMPLLEAIAGDLGLPLEFESPAARAAVLTMRIDGSLTGLGPDEALNVLLATTGLIRRDGGDRLMIAVQPARRER